MVDGPRVKGVAFRSVYGSLGTLRGQPAQQAALAVLSEELRNGFVYGAIVPGGWYPIDWYKELFRGIRSSTGEGKELAHEIGRQCTRDDMTGIYSMLAKPISPQSLFSLSQRLFSNYYSVGKVEVVESRSGYSHARWTNCDQFDENMWTEILGSSVQLLEIGGAKHVRARILVGGGDGSSSMEAAAHWS
ncbi:MAG: hypothetical protein ABUL60_13660 [Myxococcales bacterium]